MDILKLQGNIVVPTLDAYTIPILKDWLVFSSDVYMPKLLYVYHCADFRSTFEGTDPTLRSKSVIEQVLKFDFTPDDDINSVITWYRELQENSSPTLALYRASVETAYKTREYFSNVDYTERDPKGNLLYKVNDVVNALNKIPTLLKNLSDMRDKVMQEIYATNKTRNNRQISRFER